MPATAIGRLFIAAAEQFQAARRAMKEAGFEESSESY
jgi:hypothetical protein